MSPIENAGAPDDVSAPVRAAASAAEEFTSVEAQIADVRSVLREDALTVGEDPAAVDAAVAAALAELSGAHVHTFIGVLVERRVRERLRLARRR